MYNFFPFRLGMLCKNLAYKISFFVLVMFSQSCLAVAQEELETFVGIQLAERHRYNAVGMSGYRGLGLMVETKKVTSGNPVFFSTIVFETASEIDNSPNLWLTYPSRVRVSCCLGRENVEPVQNIEEDHLRFRKMPPTEERKGVLHDLYRDALDNCFVRIRSPRVLDNVRSLKDFLEEMSIRDGDQRSFPRYTKTGFSFYKDSVNCVGFCLRVLDRLGCEINGPLAVYLNHDYSGKGRGFSQRMTGWWRTRFSSEVLTLTVERCLKNLFTNVVYEHAEEITGLDGVVYRKITDEDNHIIRIEVIEGGTVVRELDLAENIQGRVTRERKKTEKIARLAPAVPGMKLINIRSREGTINRRWKKGEDGVFPLLDLAGNRDIAALFSKFGENIDNIQQVDMLSAADFRD